MGPNLRTEKPLTNPPIGHRIRSPCLTCVVEASFSRTPLLEVRVATTIRAPQFLFWIQQRNPNTKAKHEGMSDVSVSVLCENDNSHVYVKRSDCEPYQDLVRGEGAQPSSLPIRTNVVFIGGGGVRGTPPEITP